MSELNRRNVLRAGAVFTLPASLVTLMTGCQPSDEDTTPESSDSSNSQEPAPSEMGQLMKIHYLEIVTPEAEALCAQYSELEGVTFGEPDANLGGARTAKLSDGGLLGIRAPMHDQEKSVVRPYVLVDDIQASVDAAAKSGAEVAVPPMPIPTHGTCAIVIHGGIECGFWQL